MERLAKRNYNTAKGGDRYFLKALKEGKEIDKTDEKRLGVMIQFFRGGKFIDIGCHNTSLPDYVAKEFSGSEVFALDISPKLIKYFKKKWPHVNYILADARKMPFEDNSFDYAVCGEVIEHMEKPADLVKEIYRIMKPGGIFSISTPYDENAWSGGHPSPWHLWAFRPDDIGAMLKPFGLFKLHLLFADGCPKILAFCRK